MPLFFCFLLKSVKKKMYICSNNNLKNIFIMRKLLSLLVVAGLFVFASCGNNTESEEETQDTTAVEQVEEVEEVIEEVVDSAVVEGEEMEEEVAEEVE